MRLPATLAATEDPTMYEIAMLVGLSAIAGSAVIACLGIHLEAKAWKDEIKRLEELRESLGLEKKNEPKNF